MYNEKQTTDDAKKHVGIMRIAGDLNLTGGTGQLETIFSWGTLCDPGLITATGTAEIN